MKPNVKMWYHGSKDFDPERRLGPLYLTSSLALAELHGTAYAFQISPAAKWADIGKMNVLFTMDSLGYIPSAVQRMERTGADVVWDSSDFRGHPQVYVLNPRMLEYQGPWSKFGSLRLGGERSDKEKDEIYKEWRELINMGPKELEDWAKNPDRLKASLNRDEAESSGDIQSGYDSLHRIKRRVKKKRSEWTDKDYDNAAQENGFNSRMLGNDPGDPVGDTGRSKWEISLRNWGHSPSKKSSPAYSKWKSWKNKQKKGKKAFSGKPLIRRPSARRVANRAMRTSTSKQKLKNLKPNDILVVYHGTSLSMGYYLLNGFDANTVHSRLYGGRKHKGLFITPSLREAERFSSRGQLILEIAVRAKNLHGTDYSGYTGREQDMSQETREWIREKYPNSFRPYLSMTMLQKVEPQGLLRGLVRPSQILRVRYKAHGEEPVWYTRKEFLALGLETVPGGGYGPKKEVKDVGVDLSYPGYSVDEIFEHVSTLVDMPKEEVIDTLRTYASLGVDRMVDLLSKFNFGATATKSMAKRLVDHFSREGKVAVYVPQLMHRRVVSRYLSWRRGIRRKMALYEDEDEEWDHQEALEETGYWGRAGAGLLLTTGEKVLLLQRSSYVEQPHTWGAAGGAIDPDEDPRQGALREAKEEMGRVPPHRIVGKYVYQDGDFTYTTYIAKVDPKVERSWKPRLNWENGDWEWVGREDLGSYNLHFGLPPVLRKMGW